MNYPPIDEESGKIICQMCGKPFGRITAAHMKTHGLTTVEYKHRFPDAPMTSEKTKTRMKFSQSKLFKEEKSDFASDDSFPEVEEISIPDIVEYKMEQDIIPSNGLMIGSKAGILDHIRVVYPSARADYFIEKKNIQNVLEYRYVTDIADPIKKIDFEFPDTYWHNSDPYVALSVRNARLVEDGWTIVTIRSKAPTPEQIDNEIRKLIKSTI